MAERPRQRVRAYRVQHHANATKLAVFTDLLPHWQRGMVHAQVHQVRTLRAGGELGYVDTKDFPDYLTQRQWKSVINQTNHALRSWQEQAVDVVRGLIRELDLPTEQRVRLYQLNIARGWWSPTNTVHKDLTVTDRDRELARELITRALRTTIPFPNLSRVRTMLMDGPIAQREDSRTEAFTWWLRVSGVSVGKPVRIPLTTNRYLERAPGTLSSFAQVHVSTEGEVTVRLVKKSTKAAVRTSGDTIGLDWGLTALLTTSAADRLGQRLYPWLIARDRELTALQAELSRNQVRFRDSRRWRALTSRIRGYVTNEVGRILNRLAARDVRELVVEHLDFRGTFLSRTLRRIISRAGRAALARKLAALREDHGITTTKVNPAYTSQECSGCGYVASTNRSSQARFRCGFCGKTMHADVQAARVLVSRRSSHDELRFATKQQVLAELDRRFEARWGHRPALFDQRQTRPNSRATPAHLG